MTDYETLLRQAEELTRTDPWFVAVMSNLSALLTESMDRLNWAGFYLVRDGRLVVGPFQGKPACIHIEKGRGVCGTAWAEDRVQVVPDVHAFPGHIACDGASASEIVVPVHHQGRVCAVMDLDSPEKGRFSAEDAEGLGRIARMMEEKVSW